MRALVLTAALLPALLFPALPAAIQTLLIGNKGENSLSFVDLATGREVRRVETGLMPHEIAITPDAARDRAYVTNMGSASVSVIDLAARRKIADIPVGSAGFGQVTILFSADGRRLYAAETGIDRIAEVDILSGQVLGRLPAGKNGDGFAISPLTIRAGSK